MPITLIFFILLHVLCFGYFVELMRRIAMRNREYPLEESSETVPFGLIKLRHIVILYVGGYLTWVIFSIWLYAYFIA